jgi:hypothetical protein
VNSCIAEYNVKNETWKPIYQDDALVSYCTMGASSDGAVVVCAGMDGHLFIFEPTKSLKVRHGDM